MTVVSGPTPRLLNRLLMRPALAMRVRIQRAIEEAGFDDFRIAHMNVFAWLPDSGSYLEKRGYVYRTRDPSDGRAWIIRFTERGAALDQVARRALQETEREWAQALGQRAYGELLGHLERLLAVAVAEAAPGGGSPPPFADLSDHRTLWPVPPHAGRGQAGEATTGGDDRASRKPGD